MMGRKAWIILGIAAVAGLAFIGQAVSQEGPPRQGARPGGERGPRDPEQMRARMEQFRQEAAKRMKEALGASDEEWQVLQPRIEKVQTLSRQSRGGMGFMGFRGGFRAPEREGQPQAPEREQTAIEKAMDGLRKVLENKEAGADQIKGALTALRQARAQAKEELNKAQDSLREVVTVRQEAQLVAMGILE